MPVKKVKLKSPGYCLGRCHGGQFVVWKTRPNQGGQSSVFCCSKFGVNKNMMLMWCVQISLKSFLSRIFEDDFCFSLAAEAYAHWKLLSVSPSILIHPQLHNKHLPKNMSARSCLIYTQGNKVITCMTIYSCFWYILILCSIWPTQLILTNWHETWKWTPRRADSFCKPSFSMLVFGPSY